MSNNLWDIRMLNQAFEVAAWSKDPSSKVGALIVDPERAIVSTGYNGFPRRVEDSIERLNDRALKYLLVNHSEANCIADAARRGAKVQDCTLYCTHHPCATCAGMIVNAGIKRVVYASKYLTSDFIERWGENIDVSKLIFQEAGIELETVNEIR